MSTLTAVGTPEGSSLHSRKMAEQPVSRGLDATRTSRPLLLLSNYRGYLLRPAALLLLPHESAMTGPPPWSEAGNSSWS